MGLFDTIRSAVGGSDDSDQDREEVSDLLDSTALDPDKFSERAERLADRESLDFSIRSLDHLDSLIADSDAETAGDGAAETTYTDTTIELGSYLGTVLVEAYDGDWVRDEGWGVLVTGATDDVTVKVFDVAVRSLDGQPVFAAVAERLESKLTLPDEDGQQSEHQSSDEPPDSTPGVAESAAADSTASGTPTAVDDAAESDSAEYAAEESVADEPDTTESEDHEPTAQPEETTTESSDDVDETGNENSQPDDEPAAVSDDPTDLIAEAESDVESATDDAAEEPTEEPSDSEAGFSFSEAESDTTPEPDAADDSGGATEPEPPDLSAPDTDSDTTTPSGADTPATPEPDDAGPSVTDESGQSDPSDTDHSLDDPTAGDGLRAKHAETAIDFTEFWSEHDLDFTSSSLDRLDDLVDAEWDTARFADATFGSEETFDDRSFTSLVTELGSYFGEILVRELDGEWTDQTAHEAAVVVESPSGPLAIPVYKIATNSLRQTAVFAESYAALLDDLERDESS